ncbi:hypothetical protein VHEMI02521 [[Torrubiella] hemipterigena]|uniref:Uncharacterized protein n=1 Tax=[Torrubiella] hemipterigena TaxID=1531966 RepID=A0A0A1TAR1_9HYPO|nr:hypothetical protein VHEMI02521 [[Torrubiella] hemipterigena]
MFKVDRTKNPQPQPQAQAQLQRKYEPMEELLIELFTAPGLRQIRFFDAVAIMTLVCIFVPWVRRISRFLNTRMNPKKSALLSLPYELLDHITDIVYENAQRPDYKSKEAEAWRRTLSSLPRTCRGLREMMQPKLYRRVGTKQAPLRLLMALLKYEELGEMVQELVLKDWHIESYKTLEDYQSISKTINAALRLYGVRNQAGEVATCPKISYYTQDNQEVRLELQNYVSTLLIMRCPNVKVIHLRGLFWAITDVDNPTILDNMRKLTSDGTRVYTRANQPLPPTNWLYRSLHNLEEFSADHSAYRHEHVFNNFNLSAISLTMLQMERAKLLSIMRQNTRLTRLRLVPNDMSENRRQKLTPRIAAKIIGLRAETLRSLHLVWHKHTDCCRCIRKTTHIPSLRHLHKLEELSISIHGIKRGRGSKTDEEFYRRFFPCGIRKLELRDDLDVWDLGPLVDVVSTHLSLLTQVTLHCSKRSDRSRDEMLKIALASKGVTLKFVEPRFPDPHHPLVGIDERGKSFICRLTSMDRPRLRNEPESDYDYDDDEDWYVNK